MKYNGSLTMHAFNFDTTRRKQSTLYARGKVLNLRDVRHTVPAGQRTFAHEGTPQFNFTVTVSPLQGTPLPMYCIVTLLE